MPYDRTHGSPHDRGRADSYYNRSPNPHKWLDGIGRNVVTDLTEEEILAYRAGYDENERNDDHKDYRDDGYGCDDDDE